MLRRRHVHNGMRLLRNLNDDTLDPGNLMLNLNLKLVRQDVGHYAHKAARIIARHALERFSTMLLPAFVYVR
jgi:hypothetical protein